MLGFRLTFLKNQTLGNKKIEIGKHIKPPDFALMKGVVLWANIHSFWGSSKEL